MARSYAPLLLPFAFSACFSDYQVGSLETDSEDSSSTAQSGPDPSSGTLTPGSTAATSTSDEGSSSTGGGSGTSGSDSTGEQAGCGGGACAVDVLVVVDNSGTMAREQARIGRAMAGLEAGLRGRQLDVQVMFTTVDDGNPLCSPFEPPGYDPAGGSPIVTSCTERLDDFTGLGGTPQMVPEACTDACPTAVAPEDPFVAFSEAADNVPDVEPIDVDGDAEVDPPAAMAMACLAPQGINGCGYESPLEAMFEALNPDAAWNQGARPFLRPEATLAVVFVTDEADCSVEDFSIMTDSAYHELDPNTGSPQASSAICWNAGVECSAPDGAGEYECTPVENGPMQPLSRYTELLIDELQAVQGKEVVMLGIVGVPSVTERAADSPFEPQAGGVADLVYRDWEPSDIQPSDASNGVTAADKQFDFGVGPGCTQSGGEEAQAVPPSRLRAVCESLDEGSERADLRCCLESVCDDEYSGALQCLLGVLDNVHAG